MPKLFIHFATVVAVAVWCRKHTFQFVLVGNSMQCMILLQASFKLDSLYFFLCLLIIFPFMFIDNHLSLVLVK